jgi:hypothetical protein
MGQSTDANIAFGVDLQEELPYEGADENDIGAYVALREGYKNPWDDLPDEVNYGSNDPYARWRQEHPEWEERIEDWDQTKRMFEDGSPVVIDHHCSCDYPMYVVALKGTVLTASRGAPEEFGIGWMADALTMNAETRIREAQEFCEQHEFATDFSSPSWLLYSQWC